MEILNLVPIEWQKIHVWTYLVFPLILMTLDIFTGWFNAWQKNELSSSKMRSGLGKKCAELIYIVIGFLVKYLLYIDIILYFFVFYVCFMEIISLVENCDKLGFSIPIIKDKINNEYHQISKSSEEKKEQNKE